MDKLTDLEICKRIAEIEGLIFCTGNRYARIEIRKEGKLYKYSQYNPLTDGALCFKLMVKYKISLIQHQNNNAVYCIWDHDEKHATNTMWNANRSICLAIIQSKEQ
jgi:hypothetical protein